MRDSNFVIFVEQQSELIHTMELLTSALLAILCVCVRAFLSVCELPTTPREVVEGKLNSCATLHFRNMATPTFWETSLCSLWELQDKFQINFFLCVFPCLWDMFSLA